MNPDEPPPDTRHPILTALARLACRIIGTLFLIPGAYTFIRLLFVPPDDFPRRVVGLALAATAGCAAFGFLVLRFMPRKGPPIRIGHHR